jgi:hypothetical protein
MTGPELALLKASVDKVVGLTLADGERPVKVLVVFEDDDPESSDVFFVEVERQPDGSWLEKKGGESVLLDDVVRVRRLV